MNRFDDWEPQLPPADFADRTVRAMLSTHKPRRSWRRAFGLIGLAAVLAGSSAWAMMANRAPSAPAPIAVEQVAAPRRAPLVLGEEVHAPVPVFVPPAPPPAPRRVAAKPPVTPVVVAEPPPPAFPVAPRCTCEVDALICSCVD